MFSKVNWRSVAIVCSLAGVVALLGYLGSLIPPEPVPVVSVQETVLHGKVVRSSNETFNGKGALGTGVAAHLLGSKHSLFWGIAGGVATAEGCRIDMTVAGQSLALDAPSEKCEQLKGGEIVTIFRRITTTTYPDNRYPSVTKIEFGWR